MTKREIKAAIQVCEGRLRRLLKQGRLCTHCRKKCDDNGITCSRCRATKTKRARNRGNFKPWRPGGPGRPPIGAK